MVCHPNLRKSFTSNWSIDFTCLIRPSPPSTHTLYIYAYTHTHILSHAHIQKNLELDKVLPLDAYLVSSSPQKKKRSSLRMCSFYTLLHREDQLRLTKRAKGHRQNKTAAATSIKAQSIARSIGDWFCSCWGRCSSSRSDYTSVLGDSKDGGDDEQEPLLLGGHRRDLIRKEERQRQHQQQQQKVETKKTKKPQTGEIWRWGDSEIDGYMVPRQIPLSYAGTLWARGP